MVDDDKSPDPRFDAAFQRGFDGSVTNVPKVQRERLVSQAHVVIADPPPAADTVVDYPLGRPNAAKDADASDDLDDLEEPRSRTNPFLIALIVVAVALTAFGIWIAESVRAVYASENVPAGVDYTLVQMAMFAAPLAIGLGLATGIGVLFTYAIGWKRAH